MLAYTSMVISTKNSLKFLCFLYMLAYRYVFFIKFSNNKETYMSNNYTKAQAKAINKYTSKFAILSIRVSPEFKQEVTEHCCDNNISVTAFIKQAIRNQIIMDKKKRP